MTYSILIYCVNLLVKDLDDIQQNEEATEANNKQEPSVATLKNILDFARSYGAEETKSAGYVEMILN